MTNAFQKFFIPRIGSTYLLIALAWILTCLNAQATCSSPISRTNNAANSVLTSSKYNTDLNTVYNHTNELDGDCLEAGTTPLAALDTSEFEPMLDNIAEGWKCSYSDSNTISISRGGGSVDGVFVKTTTATTVTWGCGSCSAEAASSTYYVYATTASSGSTLTELISTSTPDAEGYSGTSKVICQFWNNGDQDIVTASIQQWVKNDFIASGGGDYGCYAHLFGGSGSGPRGSTNTAIRRFETVAHNNDCGKFTLNQSVTDGDSVTIDVDGVYSVSYTDFGSAAVNIGISVNSNQLTTDPLSITPGDRRCLGHANGSNTDNCSYTGRFKNGDIIRPHVTPGGSIGTGNGIEFRVEWIGN